MKRNMERYYFPEDMGGGGLFSTDTIITYC